MSHFQENIASASLICEWKSVKEKKGAPWGWESWCCAFSPDGTYFAWSSGNCMLTLVPCTSSLIHVEECFGHNTLSIHTGHLVRSAAFGSVHPSHPDEQPFWSRLSSSKDLVLATGHNNGRIRVWDVLTGKLILELLDHTDMVTDLSFDPVGSLRLMSTSYDGTLKVWNLREDGNRTVTLTMEEGGRSRRRPPVYCGCWSPDGKRIATAGVCRAVYIWDMLSACVQMKLEGHLHDVTSCAFSPDGCLLASASWDTRLILWDAYSGHMLKFFGHLQPLPHLIFACGDNGTWIRDISFSSDGAHIATVADDGYLRFWDIGCDKNPEAMAVIEDSLCCNFAPSGRILAVGSRRGSVTFWTAPLCVKPLLFLARTAIRKYCILSSVTVQQGLSSIIPRHLVDYLLYKE